MRWFWNYPRIRPFPFLFPNQDLNLCDQSKTVRICQTGSLTPEFYLFCSLTDESSSPLDPRWNMQAMDIIRNAMDFGPEPDQPRQLFLPF